MKISKEAKIGAIVLLAIAILYIGLNFLKGVNLFKPAGYYYATFTDIKGLVSSAPVKCNGHQVGLVQTIHFDYERPYSPITVELRLDKNIVIPKGSKIELVSSLLGEPSLNLIVDSTTSTLYGKGDTLPTQLAADLMESLSAELVPQINTILHRTDSIMAHVQRLLATNSAALNSSMSSIEAITASLKHSAGALDQQMSGNIPATLQNVKQISENLTQVSLELKEANIPMMASNLNQTIENIEQLSRRLKEPNNTLGLLLNDPQLYQEINSTITSANALLTDIKENPKRYINISVFGKNK